MSETNPPFELWLETEVGDPAEPSNRPQQNFCNINVTLPAGRVYALNVWTFDFLPLSRLPWPHDEHSAATPANYVVAPDLFVKSLTRELIAEAVAELIAKNEMQERWLVSRDDPDDVEGH